MYIYVYIYMYIYVHICIYQDLYNVSAKISLTPSTPWVSGLRGLPTGIGRGQGGDDATDPG